MARILVAENDPQARRFLRSALELGGHDVVEAEDGDQALRAVGDGGLDVVVSELRMPGLTGAGLVRAAARVDDHLPCLVLGGFRDHAALDDALQAGAVGVIPKPATPRQVLCLVARAHERHLLAGEAVRARLLCVLVGALMADVTPPPVARLTLGGVAARRRPQRRTA